MKPVAFCSDAALDCHRKYLCDLSDNIYPDLSSKLRLFPCLSLKRGYVLKGYIWDYRTSMGEGEGIVWAMPQNVLLPDDPPDLDFKVCILHIHGKYVISRKAKSMKARFGFHRADNPMVFQSGYQ